MKRREGTKIYQQDMAFLSCAYFIESIGPKIKVKFGLYEKYLYAHCTYFLQCAYFSTYLCAFGKRLTMITFVVILETNFFFASWTVKAHWTHFVQGKIRQQEKKKRSFSWVGKYLVQVIVSPWLYKKIFRQNTVTFEKFLLID